jgi:site-specific DNA recombinase
MRAEIRQRRSSEWAFYGQALYCRLSKDDMAQGDSESIKTQKAMLTQYAKEHGFLVVEVYVDDGWSGLNFDRPDFIRN